MIQKFEMKVSQERCLMRELGWANGTDQENLAIMSVDLSSLPGNAAIEIFPAATECSGMIVEKYQQKMERYLVNKCSINKFTLFIDVLLPMIQRIPQLSIQQSTPQ